MPTEEEKKAALQAERDSIQVTKNTPAEIEKVEAKEEDEKSEIEEIKEEIAEGEEKVEELEEKLEDKTLTAKQREKLEARIEKQRKANKDLKDENEALKRQLAEKPDDEKTYTQEDIERLADERAQQKVIQKEFEASVTRIAKGCEKLDKNFRPKIDAMLEDAGDTGLPGMMIGILDDLPENGADVLMYLTKNGDEYEDIKGLNPARMALKLKEISDKIKKPVKKVSQLPDPKEPVGGKGTTPEQRASEKDDMDSFVAKRNKEHAEYLARKRGIAVH